jgi:hypothetical protein
MGNEFRAMRKNPVLSAPDSLLFAPGSQLIAETAIKNS